MPFRDVQTPVKIEVVDACTDELTKIGDHLYGIAAVLRMFAATSSKGSDEQSGLSFVSAALQRATERFDELVKEIENAVGLLPQEVPSRPIKTSYE